VLRPCNKAIGLPAIQGLVKQLRNKTLNMFVNVLFTLFVNEGLEKITKIAKREDIKICVCSSKCSR